MTIVTTSLCSICTTCKCKGMICLDNSFSIGLETKCHGCGASKTHSTNWQVTYNIVTTVSMYVFLDIYIYIQTYIYIYTNIYIYIYTNTYIYIYLMWPHANMSTIFLSRCKQISQAECGQLAQSTVGNGFSCWVWTLDPICYRDCHITGTAFLCHDSFSKHMTFCCTKVGRPI